MAGLESPPPRTYKDRIPHVWGPSLVRVCSSNLVLELRDLVLHLVDVLSQVRVVQLTFDQPLFLLRKTFFPTQEVTHLQY